MAMHMRFCFVIVIVLAVLAKTTVGYDSAEAEWLYNGDAHGTEVTCSSEHEHGSLNAQGIRNYPCAKALDALDFSEPGGTQDMFMNTDVDLGNQYITFDFGAVYTLGGFREKCYDRSWPGTSNAVNGLEFAHADSPDGPWENVQNMDPNSGTQACNWENGNTFTFMPVSSQYWRLKIKSNFHAGYGTNIAKIEFQGIMSQISNNECNCLQGIAATGFACTSNGSAICASCDDGYDLSDLSCIEHVGTCPIPRCCISSDLHADLLCASVSVGQQLEGHC